MCKNPCLGQGFLAQNIDSARPEEESDSHKPRDAWKPGDEMCDESAKRPDQQDEAKCHQWREICWKARQVTHGGLLLIRLT